MTRRGEIVGLQFLRGFAAIGVALAHASQMVALPKYYGRAPFGGALEAGVDGVDIFFVISGFIIAIVSLQRGTLWPTISRRTFLARRAARILPLMWLAILFFVLLRIVGTPDKLAPFAYIRAALLLPFGDVEPGHIWTLRQELVFYLIFAFTFLGQARWRWLMGLWILLSLVVSVTVGKLDVWSMHRILLGLPAIQFGAGLLIGVAWLRAAVWREIKLGIHPWWVLLAATVATLALGQIGGGVIAFGILTLSATALVLLATRLHCPPDRLTALGKLLGDASYAIYLFHIQFIAVLLVAGSRLAPDIPPELALVSVALVATLGGIVIHLTIERRLVRWTQRLLSGDATKPASAQRSLGSQKA